MTSLRTPLAAIALVAAVLLPPRIAGAAEGDPRGSRDGRVAFEGPLAVHTPPVGGPEARRWGPAGGALALPIGETLAVSLVMMGWNRYVGAAPWAEVTPGTIGRNLRSAWLLDDNAFWVNQLGHPYQGTWSFTAARSSGLGFWSSVPFAFGASALWEVAGETERPALNDQVTTTMGGVVLGEILHRFASVLRADGGGWRTALAAVLSPMGTVNGSALGLGAPLSVAPSRWQLSLGTVAVEGTGVERGPVAALPYGAFSFTWGLPGAPGLELERPFDHFVVEAGYGLGIDPVATVRARGLLAGDTFDLEWSRGLFGVYLSFDLDTPPRHQVSTSAIGVGGSARTEVGGGCAVEADGIVSAVFLGAGSHEDRGATAGERDYRFGPGQQAYAGLRLVAGTRATLGAAVRQYLLLGAGADAGSAELLVEESASAVVRIAGAHAVGIEVSRLVRRASAAGAPGGRESDTMVRAYYALLGGAAAAAPGHPVGVAARRGHTTDHWPLAGAPGGP